MGRAKKYKTAKALGEAVDGYFNSISFLKPVVVTTLTGLVDAGGKPETQTRMLTENSDGTGKPLTVREYFEPPSVAALCLKLGICRDTWSSYASDEALAPVVEQARQRMEAYLAGQLAGKHVQGVIFNLKNNFGWKDKTEIGMDAATRKAMAGADMTMAEKRELLLSVAKDFEDET